MQRRSQHQKKPVSKGLGVVEAPQGKNCAAARESHQGALDENSGEEDDGDIKTPCPFFYKGITLSTFQNN